MNKSKTNKGLLICFTNWQVNNAYKIYADYFAKYGIKLESLKIDEYVLCIDNGKPNIGLFLSFHSTSELSIFLFSPFINMKFFIL